MTKYIYIGTRDDLSECRARSVGNSICDACPGKVRSLCCFNHLGHVINDNVLFMEVTDEQFENWRGFD